MKKIYVLFTGWDSEVAGYFSTPEKAKEYAIKIYSEEGLANDIRIEEYILDEGLDG